MTVVGRIRRVYERVQDQMPEAVVGAAFDAMTWKDRRGLRGLLRAVGMAGAFTLVVGSAIVAKEASVALPPLTRLDAAPAPTPDVQAAAFLPVALTAQANTPQAFEPEPVEAAEPAAEALTSEDADEPEANNAAEFGPDVRWFNGRPVRPVRTMEMKVTAYSPDHRSCGIWADGKTATLHSVWTNAGALVAADTRLLPFGSLVSVPGYDGGRIVPVLDRGGAIKGHRLDVLYPTHRRALKWGVQDLPVVVWEYADGKPADNPRKLR